MATAYKEMNRHVYVVTANNKNEEITKDRLGYPHFFILKANYLSLGGANKDEG